MIDYKDPQAVMEICRKATPGPWEYKAYDSGLCFMVQRIDKHHFKELEHNDGNTNFIALSREALPYMAAEVERLREENRRLKVVAMKVEELTDAPLECDFSGVIVNESLYDQILDLLTGLEE